MPNMDGTGPLGEGPMTGFGRGKCLTDDKNNFSRFNYPGAGRKRGYGLGPCSIANNDRETLLAQKTLLEKRLELINEQLKDEK